MTGVADTSTAGRDVDVQMGHSLENGTLRE